MNAKNNRFFSLNGGISLIMLVFVVLTLVSFAALSLTSARADRRLSEKYKEQTTAYYQARNESRRYLADYDAARAGGPASSSSGRAAVAASVPDSASGTVSGTSETVRFPAGESQELVLTVRPLSQPDADGHPYEILEERMESIPPEYYDEALPVIR